MALFAQSTRRSVQNEISDLSSDLAGLTHRLSSMASDAGSSAGGWLSASTPTYGQARDMAGDGASLLWREAGRALDGAEHHIRRRPAAAALALVGVGIVLGLMAKR